MAVWRAHGLPPVLRECWAAGAGAGLHQRGSRAHPRGPPIPFVRAGPVHRLAGLIGYSNGVHDDLDDQPRQAGIQGTGRRANLAAGYATEDGVGLHYVGTALHEAVSIRPGKHAWRVDAAPGGGYREEPIEPRLI